MLKHLSIVSTAMRSDMGVVQSRWSDGLTGAGFGHFYLSSSSRVGIGKLFLQQFPCSAPLFLLKFRANYWRFIFSEVMIFFRAEGPGVVFLVKLQCCNHQGFSLVQIWGVCAGRLVGVDLLTCIYWTWLHGGEWCWCQASCFLVNMIDDKMAQPINGY